MKPYVLNFLYIWRHKWWVFWACCAWGIPGRGLLHDWSKFRPSEFGPYARWFYGGGQATRTRTGEDSPAFVEALRRHFNRNEHHWEYLLMLDGRVLPMRDPARREMLADWWGAGRARQAGYTWRDVAAWYRANAARIILHPATRAWVERALAEKGR